MTRSLPSIWRRRIDLGVTLVVRSSLKCDSKKIFAAAAFSIVAIEGSHNRGASWRGITKSREGECSAVDSQEIGGELSVTKRPFCVRSVVSADRGPPEETREVGAVDCGAPLLPGLKPLEGREDTSDIGVLGEMVVFLSLLCRLK